MLTDSQHESNEEVIAERGEERAQVGVTTVACMESRTGARKPGPRKREDPYFTDGGLEAKRFNMLHKGQNLVSRPKFSNASGPATVGLTCSVSYS